MIATTRTGSFPLGFRIGWSDWQKDLKTLLTFARDTGFAVLDTGADAQQAGAVVQAGFSLGTVDLPHVGSHCITENAEQRRRAVDEAIQLIDAAYRHGARRFFACLLPREPQLERKRNQELFYEGYTPIVNHLASLGASLAIEGYPGDGAVCCTPESYRLAIAHFNSPAVGINYDPSHLIRMGIDPLRFLREFAKHVVHVHGKDGRIDPEQQYEFGTEQRPIHPQPGWFHGGCWRYTIPGHGVFDWSAGFEVLQAAGYTGAVCVELEDDHFNHTEAGERRGLTLSLQYLSGC